MNVPCDWASEEEFWQIAAQNVPLRFPLLRRSLSIEQIETQVTRISEWAVLKNTLRKDDLIWPLEFNRNSWAYRNGFVIVRSGKPIGVEVTVSG